MVTQTLAQLYTLARVDYLSAYNLFDRHLNRKHFPGWKKYLRELEDYSEHLLKQLTTADLEELKQLLPRSEVLHVELALKPKPTYPPDYPW